MILRLVFTLVLAFSALAVSPPSALAATPSNDTFLNATAAAIGFSATLDTTQATTDSDDAQLNASCGAPATDASVWYAFTAASDIGVVVDVSQSNYSAGVLVGVGTQGNLQTVTCGPGTVAFSAAAGTTYYVLAIDDQDDGGGNGGNLRISFNEVPPSPTVDITVNSTGTVDAHTGIATISGTYTCSNGSFIEAFVDASQKVGNGRNATIFGSGSFFASGTCDGAPHTWSVAVVPQSGKFAGGKAMTVTFAFACGAFQCTEGFVEQTVQLRGGKK
jgi:hypothetical protein